MSAASIVDLDRYPIDRADSRVDLAAGPAADFARDGVAALPGFVRAEAVERMAGECDAVAADGHHSASEGGAADNGSGHRDERIGLVTSGGWSFTLGQSIALGYVRPHYEAPGTKLTVLVHGERCAATVGTEPLYDPTNAKLRA